MSTRINSGMSLTAERAEKVAEILRHEPLLGGNRNRVINLAIDVAHRQWAESGRDLKRVLGAKSAPLDKERAS